MQVIKVSVVSLFGVEKCAKRSCVCAKTWYFVYNMLLLIIFHGTSYAPLRVHHFNFLDNNHSERG